MNRPKLLILWSLVAAVALFVNLGGYPLLDADEGRNGEVGREMAATNDYVMPRFDGLPYVDKPIVYFAAEAAAMEVLGPTETAARLPALLFTLLTAALVAWFARRVWDEEAAFASAVAMLSMPLVLAFSRTVIFDSALTLFITLAMVAFWFAVEGSAGNARHPERSEGSQVTEMAAEIPRSARDDGGRAGQERGRARKGKPRLWATVAWLAIALGVITKGPVAIALPLMVAIPYAIKRRRFGALWSWGGLVAFVAVIAPWVWGVTQVVPDFLHYVLVTETAQRLATKALKRTGPPWYFIPYVVGGALPWIFLAAFRKREKDGRNIELYLLLWVLVPFVFFSISQSKRPQYVLPLMPAIALLASRATRGVRVAAVAFLTLGVALLGALEFAKLRGEYVAPAKSAAIVLGVAFLLAGIVALVSKRRDVAFVALSLPALLIPIAANPLLNAIAERRSTKSLVMKLMPYVTTDTEVTGVEAFTGSMAFYLRRPIVIYTPDAEETTSNYLIRHYGTFAGAAGSPIRPMTELPRALAERGRARVWLVREGDAANRKLVESSGASLVAEGAHFVAYTMPR
jgi:4-amino-4-deoxy-L-arabinose transferase-like glycosyltransferase